MGKTAHQGGYRHAKQHGRSHRALQSGTDARLLLCPVVLGDKGGKGVAEVLHRHIGEGVNLHRRREGGHDRGAKAVDQSLYHQDPEVHHRLLNAGQDGKRGDLPDTAPADGPWASPELGTAKPGVHGDPDSGDVLGDHRGLRRSCHAPLQSQDKPQVQGDIQHGGDCQEYQRHHGITQRPQK